MTSNKPAIAFFGATGGTGNAALARALTNGQDSTALVRNPEKLGDMLTTRFQLSAGTTSQYLTIHKGDVKSAVDASKALVCPSDSRYLVDTIFFSVGGYPSFQFSIKQPMVLTDPTICEDAMKSVLAGLDHLAQQGVTATRSGEKPLLVVISATAGEKVWNEVPLPWLVAPLYCWLLSSPQKDKLRMEKMIEEDKAAHVRGFVIVRPAFLTEGPPKGLEQVKMGWQWNRQRVEQVQKEPGRVIGWTIGKSDLGAWVSDKVLTGDGSSWVGKLISLCY